MILVTRGSLHQMHKNVSHLSIYNKKLWKKYNESFSFKLIWNANNTKNMLFLGWFLHQEITFSMQAQHNLKKDMCQAKWWCSVKGYTDPDEPVTGNKK